MLYQRVKCTVRAYWGRVLNSFAFGIVFFGSALVLPAWGEVVLPVEVMGPPPHIETVTLTLDAGEGSKAANLRVKAHNVSYRNKGLMRVNNGDWFMLWNDVPAIKMAKPDRAYGGFGGGFSTITFNIGTPNVQFRDGDNTIEFKYQYKHPDHGTAGYRIIYLDIRDEANQSLLPANATTFDDPRTWGAPPLTNAGSVAAGKEVWQNGNPGGPNCMDCHTNTGRDLKYFNISNKVIIEQCKKSGFTPQQGRDVASYIRSIDIPVVPQARPWNPPYQPGPGTDSRPVYEWAAGAGLNAVLKSDKDMLPHIFGSGTQGEIDAATDLTKDMNLREMPIAVQFPDWIHWLPRTHPMDVWGKNYWETEKGVRPVTQDWNNPHQSYLHLRSLFMNNNLANRSDLVSTVDNQFQRNVLWWIGDGHSGHPWTDLEGKNVDRAKARGYTAEEAKLNLSRWRAVKLWELFHTYDAEDKADDHIPTAEKYEWPARGFSTFQLAAHFIGDDRGTSCFAWESPEVGIYFSSIWYQLQMVLTCGMRQGADVSPVDWVYNFYHIKLLGKQTGIYEPLRLAQNLIKGYQQRYRPGTAITKETWSMRDVAPWRLYSDYDGDQSTFQHLNTYETGGNLRLRFLRSMLGRFVDRVNEYEISDWPRIYSRESTSNWHLLEYPNYIPRATPDSISAYKLFTYQTGDSIEADCMFRLIPRLAATGLEAEAIQPLADWAAQLWPRADWSFNANSAPEILSAASASPSSPALNGSTTLSVVADDTDGDPLSFSWDMVNGPAAVRFDTAGAATTVARGFTAAGEYQFRVRVSDGQAETASSVTVVVVGEAKILPTVEITSPTSGAQLPSGQDVLVRVNASDNNGIKQVRIQLDGIYVGDVDYQAPYEWNLGTIPIGPHRLRAFGLANDIDPDTGKAEWSYDQINIEVTAATNEAPVILSPATAAPSTIKLTESTSLSVQAQDPDGDVLTYSWSLLSGPGTADFTARASASTEAQFTAAGSYELKVTISDGLLRVEGNVTVVVEDIVEKSLPTVQITSPANGAQLPSGQDILVKVDASDNHGINQILLQLDGTYVGHVDYQAPYEWILTAIPTGSHVLRAFAIANDIDPDTGQEEWSYDQINVEIVQSSNAAPSITIAAAASPSMITLGESTSLSVSAADPNGDPLTYAWRKISGPGTVTFATNGTAGSNTTVAEFAAQGSYELEVVVSDGELQVSGRTVVTVVENTGGERPTADDQSLTVRWGRELPITLTGGPKGAELTFEIISMPSGGTLTGTPPSLTYQSQQGFKGLDSFTFKVNDGTLDSHIAKITIDVTNQKPSGKNRTITLTTADVQATLLNTSAAATDSGTSFTLTGTDDDGDMLTYRIQDLPSNGTLSGTIPELSYIPNSGFSGTDRMTYIISDGLEVSEPVALELIVPSEDTTSGTTGTDDSSGGCSTGNGRSGTAWLIILSVAIIWLGRRSPLLKD